MRVETTFLWMSDLYCMLARALDTTCTVVQLGSDDKPLIRFDCPITYVVLSLHHNDNHYFLCIFRFAFAISDSMLVSLALQLFDDLMPTMSRSPIARL
jgi:hypothetical protein